jgi:hypothetical protein
MCGVWCDDSGSVSKKEDEYEIHSQLKAKILTSCNFEWDIFLSNVIPVAIGGDVEIERQLDMISLQNEVMVEVTQFLTLILFFLFIFMFTRIRISVN